MLYKRSLLLLTNLLIVSVWVLPGLADPAPLEESKGILMDCPDRLPGDSPCQVFFKKPLPGEHSVLAYSPLTLAIRNGRLDQVKQLLKNGFSLKAQAPEQMSPVMAAVKGNQLEILQFLFEQGADIRARDKDGRSALFYLNYTPDADLTNKILQMCFYQGAELDAQDHQGETVLMQAAELGHADLVKRLLDLGAKPNLVNHKGQPALYLALNDHSYVHKFKPDIPIFKYAETARLLLEHGADPHLKTEVGKTAFDQALDQDSKPLWTLLATNSPKLADGEIQAALKELIEHEDFDLLYNLAQNGLDPQFKTEEGSTQLMSAALVGQAGLVKKLLALGANPAEKNAQGETALNLAIQNQQGAVISLLLPLSQDLDEQVNAAVVQEDLASLQKYFSASSPEEWANMMIFATQSGHHHVLRWAQAQGRDLNMVDAQGNNLLSYCLFSNQLKTLEWLLQQGVSPLHRNQAGSTVIQQAEKLGNSKMLALMNSHS